MDIAGLTDEELQLVEEITGYAKYHKLEFWQPYPKQMEFIALGAKCTERAILAANQVGKSDVGAYETATHLTGIYPEGWPGRKWDRPVEAWACGESTTVVRDVQQSKLFGSPGVEEEFGTGFIPKDLIVGKPTLARGAVADAYDSAWVRHQTDGIFDGISKLQFKSYEQGRKKFQGKTNDFDWWDEEPPEDVYTEGNTRWNATGGMCMMTFTPLQGMSTVVRRYWSEPTVLRQFVRMTIYECPHMTPEMIQQIKDKYPQHQWAARLEGFPYLGAGAVFTVDPTSFMFPAGARIPDHWAKLWCIDFGLSHPFAAVLCAWDRDNDIFYVLKEYKIAGSIPLIHAAAMNRLGVDIPVIWPHDGNQGDKFGNSGGLTLAKQYKAFGLKMLPSHATFPEGGFSTEAAIMEIDQRLKDGRFKVSEDCLQWLEEYRGYHRNENGLLVKEHDDLLSATMKGVMMKRKGRPGPILGRDGLPVNKSKDRPKQRPAVNPWTMRPVNDFEVRRPRGDTRENWQPTFNEGYR